MLRYTSIEIGGDVFIEPRQVSGRGMCALQQMLFTIGLVTVLQNQEKEGRYCSAKEDAAAYMALLSWDGIGHPSGPWIKHKTVGIDECNPNTQR